MASIERRPSKQPFVHRGGQAVFDGARKGEGAPGQDFFSGLMDNPFAGSVAESQRIVQREGEFDDAIIKEWAAILDTMSHAHAIGHLQERLQKDSAFDVADVLDHGTARRPEFGEADFH